VNSLIAPRAPARPGGRGLLYPADSVELRVLDDGRPLLLRPLGARDAELVQDFVRGLSPRSRYQRFQSSLRELPPGLLGQLLHLDYRRTMAFAAVVFDHGHARMIAEARYAPAMEGDGSADFALAVADRWQRQGLGAMMLEKLLQHAERSGIARVHGDVLQDNSGMLRLTRQLGFVAGRHPDGAWLARVERSLGAVAIAA
jgi:acetyltransferase